MEVKEAVKSRRSTRAFSPKPIPRNLIEGLVDCGRLAPTARNVQPWEFIAITQKGKLKEIASLIDNGRFIADCACCIAVLCKDTKYYLEDGCAATENMLIAAVDGGLSACWVAGDKKPYCDAIKSLLGVPADFKLVSLIALGYNDSSGGPIPQKRPLAEILHWENFASR